MSNPAPAQALTVDNLYHKIGVLSINNEFLSNEVERLNIWIITRVKEFESEIDKIEASAKVDGKAISEDVQAVINHIRAKL